MSIFSDNLRLFRTKSRRKQSFLAEKIGITSSAWSNYEVGKSEPNINTIIKIAALFEISLDTLLNHDASPFVDRFIQKNASLITKEPNLNRFKTGETPDGTEVEDLMNRLAEKDRLIKILTLVIEKNEEELKHYRQNL